MKKYFYVITINLIYYSKGENKPSTYRISKPGLIEIKPTEDKPSLIYDKILKVAKIGWENINISSTVVEFFNYWAEKENLVNKIEDEPLKQLSEEEMLEMLNRPLIDLDVSVRTMGILKTTGLKTLSDVISRDETFFRRYRGFGDLSVNELKKTLREKGLKLAE
jgi:hypothetical protein